MANRSSTVRRKIPAPERRANLLARNLAVRKEVSAAAQRCYVSYAWGDATPEGKARDDAVEGLCTSAEAEGIVVMRDKFVVRPGDRLSEFMKQLGNGDRIFVLLSDKYIRSPYCMTELSEVWRNSRQDASEFCRRIRAFTLPCARIRDLSDRVAYGASWKTEHDKVEKLIREHGSGMLGRDGSLQHQMIARIAAETTDLLTMIADVVVPGNFQDFLRYGFDGLKR